MPLDSGRARSRLCAAACADEVMRYRKGACGRRSALKGSDHGVVAQARRIRGLRLAVRLHVGRDGEHEVMLREVRRLGLKAICVAYVAVGGAVHAYGPVQGEGAHAVELPGVARRTRGREVGEERL